MYTYMSTCAHIKAHIHISLYNQGSSSGAQSAVATRTGKSPFSGPWCRPCRSGP